VGRGDQLLAFQPWGEASKSFRIPVTDRTLFHIGSVGKQITAAAILRLEQDGRITADRPIGSYVKGLPASWADIPVRHLLSHTSGLPDYLSVLTDWDRPQPRAAVLSAVGSLPLNFAPGEAFDYSNTGYLLLGWLINDVSGRSYPDYMRELLADAGTPSARLDAAGDIIENRAEPYTVEKGRLVHAARMESGVSAAADGGVLMSARDVAPWSQALHGGRLVPASTLRRALSPTRLLTGRYAPYNYGFHLAQTRGQRLHNHSGSGIGFMSHWAGLPDRSLAALVVTNYEGPNGLLLHEVAHAALEAVAPGSTYLSLPEQRADPKSRALKALLERSDKNPDPAILAPELARLGQRTRGVPRMREPIETLLPIETYEANGGEMVRYRVMQGGRAKHPLVGWTKEDQIFWMA
jgi:D-alanyl-D-alanine carboxypeptidase